MLRLSDVSVICRFTYFQFPTQSAFLPFMISVARQHCGISVLIRNIGHETCRGKTKLILTVKMETRHPVDSQFGSEFPAICNHCGVMAV